MNLHLFLCFMDLTILTSDWKAYIFFAFCLISFYFGFKQCKPEKKKCVIKNLNKADEAEGKENIRFPVAC